MSLSLPVDQIALGVNRLCMLPSQWSGGQAHSASRFMVVSPLPLLARYIDHYWFSLHSNEDTFAVLPDGAVDLVLDISGDQYQVCVYGSATRKTDISITPGNHYLGIRFRPGCSRHFLDVSPKELLDSFCSGRDLLRFDAGRHLVMGLPDVFRVLDEAFVQHLGRQSGAIAPVSTVVQHIEMTNGASPIGQLADKFGWSRRQLERHFLESVGMSAKLFSEIVRYQRACALINTTRRPLAHIAADLGFTDQSHLTHQFRRFHGQSPGKLRKTTPSP